MNKQNTGIAIAVGIVIVAVVVILLVVRGNKRDAAPVVSSQDEAAAAQAAGTQSSASASKPVASLSRKDALVEYQGKVIRVTDACSGETVTHSFSVPAGTRFMIDNDSDKTHTVVIEQRTVVLKPMHYAVEVTKEMGVMESICNPETGVTTVALKKT